ncbi:MULTISPECIES: hypothetical protein [Aquimarina]|uniref:hypothetical protein n=1 Tax=Aquimarina TaxID=290174 RepID=UPI0013572431|nr:MULTISPECIES: hypothetical protein [Aquimarina]
MKNQILDQYTSLSSKEVKTINGGCGGEDVECPELKKLVEALNNLRFLINL